jgi:hypothetical protein
MTCGFICHMDSAGRRSPFKPVSKKILVIVYILLFKRIYIYQVLVMCDFSKKVLKSGFFVYSQCKCIMESKKATLKLTKFSFFQKNTYKPLYTYRILTIFN